MTTRLRLLSTVRRENQPDGLQLSACRVYRNAEYDEFIVKPMRGAALLPEASWHFASDSEDAKQTACAMLWPLSAAQHAAIRAMRERHGWKETVRQWWERGNYPSWLGNDSAVWQQLRNTYGPEWLEAYPK